MHPSLACATVGGKVLVHDPLAASEGRAAVRFLSFNKRITSLASGSLDSAVARAMTSGRAARDLLFVGTETTLLAHDVERNADVFTHDVPDGVHSVLAAPERVGSDAALPPLVIAGGNCSIQGFDAAAEERFWTVSGDHVRALALADLDGDGRPELLVGSDDFAIRVFKEEVMVSEVMEAAPVVALCALRAAGVSHAYALANGTVGVYRGAERAWRMKSRAKVTALVAFDIDGDGMEEIISGWSNGRVEIRSADGKLLHSETTRGGVAVSALLVDNYCDVRTGGGGGRGGSGSGGGEGGAVAQQQQQQQLIVVAQSGEVRGFAPMASGGDWGAFTSAAAGDASSAELEELLRAKRELTHELRATRRSSSGGSGGGSGSQRRGTSIPASTNPTVEARPRRLKQPSSGGGAVELLVRTNSSAVIRCVVVLALESEATFDGESHVVWPSEASSEVAVHLTPRCDGATVLQLRIFVAARGGVGCAHHRVYERQHRLPCFAMCVVAARSSLPLLCCLCPATRPLTAARALASCFLLPPPPLTLPSAHTAQVRPRRAHNGASGQRAARGGAFMLCTVTSSPNPAHNLTCSPSYILI